MLFWNLSPYLAHTFILVIFAAEFSFLFTFAALHNRRNDKDIFSIKYKFSTKIFYIKFLRCLRRRMLLMYLGLKDQ